MNLDGVPTDELQRAITFLGFEVEGVVNTALVPLANVVVGEIKTRAKHPNADKLSVCTVDVGATHGGIRTIVCGAPNCDAGNRVPVALPGAVLPGDFRIKQSKIRGQPSDGMMCAPDELGLGGDHAGLLILDGSLAIGLPINEALPGGDTVFDLEITPNRPDALSHIGIARELGAWFRKDVTYPEVTFRGETHGVRPDILGEIRVESPEDCPLYVGFAVAGVKVGPSPAWMQERLKAVGLRPINNLVDVGNYVMLELGQPLHVFDAKKISGRKIVIRLAADGEKITTLDAKERALNSRMLVIADATKPLVVAGIMGGADAGVDESTTDIVLEAAYFRPQSVRATSKRLGLASDSSYRFERGVDPHSTLEAARRAVDLLLETAGGTVVGPSFQVGGDRPWSREITVTPAYINERLGFEIPATEQRAALEALNLRVVREEPTEQRGPAWTVSVPSYRGDLDRPIDLVEEVLRLYGTEKVPAAPAVGPALVDSEDAPTVIFNRAVTSYLVGQHFHECVNYTLRSAKELKTWVSDSAVQELALTNPFVEEQSHLRPTLVLGLLESLKLNQSRGNHVARLFETGRVFMELNGIVQECAGVGFIIAEDPKARTWLPRPAPDFFAVKRHVEIIAAAAGIDLAAQPLVPVTGAYWGWQEGQAAAAGEIKVGWTVRFGLLNLAMVRAAGIEGKVWAGMFAILPEKLAEQQTRRMRPKFQPVSNFPAALRDVAVVADQATTTATVQTFITGLTPKLGLAADVKLEVGPIFDQPYKLPGNKQSLAFPLHFASGQRTLTDQEVNDAFKKLQMLINESGNYNIRS